MLDGIQKGNILGKIMLQPTLGKLKPALDFLVNDFNIYFFKVMHP